MRTTLTVSLPEKLRGELDRQAKREGRNRSDVVRRSIAHYLFLQRYEAVTAKLTAEAGSRGGYTDEDVQKRLGISR